MSTQAIATGSDGQRESDRVEKRERRPPLARAHYVLLPLVLFVVIPAHILAGSMQDLAAFEPAGFLLLGLTAVVFMLLLMALGQLEARMTSRRFISMVVEFALFFVVITGFVLPASASSGLIEAEAAPADVGHVLGASAIAFAMLLMAGSTARRSVYAAVVAFVGINALLTMPAIYPLVVGPAVASVDSRASIYSLSRDRNVILISFDGISGSAVVEALERDPGLERRLGGFTLYTGVASSAPVTSASTATSLSGNIDRPERILTVEDLWDQAPERLITNQLDRNDWLVSTYGAYTYKFHEPTRAYSMLASRPPPSPFRLLNYGLARSLTRLFAVSGPLADELDGLYATGLGLLADSSHDRSTSFVASHAPWWKRGLLTPTVLDFNELLDNVHVGTDEPVAHFMHFTHTHFPVEFDRECRWAAWDEEWYLANQDRDGEIGMTHCALTQLAAYLDKLRFLGAFDDSLIVLKSDHGMPPTYYGDDSIESFQIRDGLEWGYGQYAPFLAIKDFGPAHGPLSLDDHPVLLDDLARTLCVHADIDANCQTYGGYDLLGDDWSGIEDDEVTLFIVAGSGSSLFDTYETLPIERGSDILESMHSRLSDEVLRSSVSCAVGIDVATGEPLNNGMSDRRSWLMWHDRGSSFLRFRMDQPCASLHVLVGDMSGPIVPDDFAVVVNDQKVDAGAVGDSMPVTSGQLSFSVPSSMWTGARDIVIEIRPSDRDRDDIMPIRGIVFER